MRQEGYAVKAALGVIGRSLMGDTRSACRGSLKET
jgi:hypothetical protein